MITQLLTELIETVVSNVKNPPIKIYGTEWGEPPSDSEWCFDSDDEDCRDEFEQQNWWGESLTIIRANFEDESEYYDDGDVAEYWNERQYDCR